MIKVTPALREFRSRNIKHLGANEYSCPEDKEDHAECIHCGGYGTIPLYKVVK